MRAIRTDWARFWFRPRSVQDLLYPRIALGTVAAIWFASFWPNLSLWFGENGVLSTETAAAMIELEELPRWQMWSPLWWSDSLLAYQFWLVAGVVLSGMLIVGLGGRWTVALLTAWVIAWAHRCTWLIGLTEPALVACIGYFLLQPGPRLLLGRSQTSVQQAWTAGTTLRLLQTHWWLLFAIGLLSQLASFQWWRGEAIWWLAAAGKSNLLSTEQLLDRPLLVNALTHAVILAEMLALWLVLIRSTRILGIVFGLLSCAALAFLGDQFIYALFLASLLLAYLPDTWRP